VDEKSVIHPTLKYPPRRVDNAELVHHAKGRHSARRAYRDAGRSEAVRRWCVGRRLRSRHGLAGCSLRERDRPTSASSLGRAPSAEWNVRFHTRNNLWASPWQSPRISSGLQKPARAARAKKIGP